MRCNPRSFVSSFVYSLLLGLLTFHVKKVSFVVAWNNLFLLLLLVVKAIAFLECIVYSIYLCFFLINRYRGYCPQLKYECGHTYGIATDKLTSVRETSLKCKYCFCLSLLNLTPQTIPRTVLELSHHTYIYTAFV